MKKSRFLLLVLPLAMVIATCTSEPEPVLPTEEEATESVLAKERAALDNWSAGNPGGFAVNLAPDVTYMDDIGAHSRLDGFEEVQAYLSSLEGMIPKHDYEVLDPMVQLYGNVAVLTFRYQGSVDGQPGPPWKATSVYRYTDEDWKAVHAHWSLVKEQPAPEEGAEGEAAEASQ